ncbi:MAG: MotA/TolQ/ExbB proton channel family protein [Verrucomicrobia bacterium]|nr:MAG: MotA/TolQ/ExbB proton channel family protein [Verrucomicrobiota bacterium]
MFENILNVFQLGGPMMIPLAALGFVGVLIFTERLLYLHKGQIRAEEFVSGIKSILKKKRVLEALTLCDETVGPVPRVVKAALLSADESAEAMSQAVNAAAVNEFSLIERRVASVALVAKIAPLLGLMGTVVALLEMFYAMGQSGSYVSASEFSGQIYAALLSTATGLFICILGWLGYSFLNGRVRALAHDIEWAANETMLFILRGMPDNENLHMSPEGEK